MCIANTGTRYARVSVLSVNPLNKKLQTLQQSQHLSQTKVLPIMSAKMTRAASV